MLDSIWGQLRGRAGRSVALLVGVLAPTTGFVGLTGATTTSRLAVMATTVSLAGVLANCLAALVPAALLRRLPTARLSAQE